MNWPRPVRIAAVGSPCGDDGAGWEVVQQLRSQGPFGPDVELHRLEGGQRILDVLDGRGTLVLIDAIEAGSTPGTTLCFEWPDERLEALRPGTTHDMRPAEALRLAEALQLLPPRVVVFGIEMEGLSPLTGLSGPVSLAAARLARQVIDKLNAGGQARALAAEPLLGDH